MTCTMVGPPSARGVGQQAEEARPLDRLRELALLLGRDCSDAARHDLAALGDEALQQLHVLVVDLRRVGAGEGAGFAAAKEGAPGAAHGAPTGGRGFAMVAHASAPASAGAAAAACSRGS